MDNCIKIIDYAALDYNLKYIKSKLAPKTKLCAVVKDDAYGHGIKNVIKPLLNYADYFAVATVEEGIKLRELTTLPILVLGECKIEKINDIKNNDLEITISSLETLKILIKNVPDLNIKIHLAINSGMHRLGFNNKTGFSNALKIIKKHKNFIVKGIYSHIGDATNNKRLKRQKNTFNSYLKLLSHKIHPIVHIANSDTMHTDSTMHFDMVRIGLNIYGYGNSNLKPVMSVIAKIVHTTKLKSQDYVGYGSMHILPPNTKLAIVSIGYGQGFFRSNAQFGFVIINKKLCKIVANVCMDMIIVDITNVKCKIGDYAVVMGKQGLHSIDANLLATFNKTIPYEILTSLGQIKNSILINQSA